MFRHGICHFVGGSHHNTVKTFFHRQIFSGIHAHIGAVNGNGTDCFIRKIHGFVHGTLLHRDQAGQHLRGTGGVKFLMDIFGV